MGPIESDGGLAIEVEVRVGRPVDRLGVAMGNASLLGVGYVMLGRLRTAVAYVVVTAGLVCGWVFAPASWVGAVLVVWWMAGIVHGWVLATRAPRRAASWSQRVLALAIVVPLLLGFGVVRFQTFQLQQDIADGRAAGDCGPVLAAEGRIKAHQRLVDALTVRHLHQDSDVCHQLQDVAKGLDNGLQANLTALADSFATMAAALAKPGNEPTVGTTLDGFLGKLPLKDQPCDAVTVTDWMRKQKADSAVLGRAIKTAQTVAPTAIVNCGDRLMSLGQWTPARAMYQRLIKEYGTDPLTVRAKNGMTKATQQIELAQVEKLFGDHGTIAYCSTPARYSGAPAPRKGVNRTKLIDASSLAIDSRVPGQWLTYEVTQTVFVVCTDTKQNGPATRTCPYHSIENPSLGGDVTFHKASVPVKVYELRTGRLVLDSSMIIDGASCPANFTDTTANGYPPSDTLVEPSDADIQAAFRPLITR